MCQTINDDFHEWVPLKVTGNNIPVAPQAVGKEKRITIYAEIHRCRRNRELQITSKPFPWAILVKTFVYGYKVEVLILLIDGFCFHIIANKLSCVRENVGLFRIGIACAGRCIVPCHSA